MDRMRRIMSLWNWLPSFRAVAEAEHLPTAAKRLHLTPSALSRTIHLLESDLGFAAFARNGRRIELNPQGERLLSGVRDAMRLIDDVLEGISGRALMGPVYVSSGAPIAEIFVLPAISRLLDAHPDLVPCIRSAIPDGEANAALLRGDADVALVTQAIQHRELEVQRIADLECGIYCGPHHPLAPHLDAAVGAITRYPFAAPEETEPAYTAAWPVEIQRRVGLRAPRDLLPALCASGPWLAVLPDAVAQHSNSRLRRFLADIARPVSVFAVRRKQRATGTKADALLAALREEFAVRSIAQ
jgi:DNA-binding transcriptional LysR family regulator